MNEAIERLNALHAKVSLGGPEKAKQKHIERGKMLPREYYSRFYLGLHMLIYTVE